MSKQSGFSKWKRNRIIKNDLNNLALLRTKYSIVTTENNSLSTPSAPAVNNSNVPPNVLTSQSNDILLFEHQFEPRVNCSSNNISEITTNTNTYCDKPSEDSIIVDHHKIANDIQDDLLLSQQITEKLKLWAVTCKISHLSLRELLKIICLIPGLENTSKDPRTFLHTPRNTIIRNVNPGTYFHLGIANGLNNMFKYINTSDIPNIIEVGINIDGLPLCKSSSSQLYPILCIVNNVKISPNIFPIGIYHGNDKPLSFNDFLEEFVNESVILTTQGLNIKDKSVLFKITMFLFDAVAKSSVLYIKGHSGYSSCTKCIQEGEYINNRICFPEIKFIKRTNTEFLNKTDQEHHTGESIMERIPHFEPVSAVPLDYMHLICLGVVKKFVVSTWCFGRPPHKLCARDIINISNTLISLIKYTPIEFARKPRALKEAKRWKATEFRNFLLYTGPIVLKNVLEKVKYEHFLTLHVAISILSSDNFKQFTDYAEELLEHFVLCTKHIYSPEFLTHNIHNLLHITDDVRTFGNLNLFSNFPAENYLQKLKKMVRKSDNVLPQVVRRLTEEMSIPIYSLISNTNMNEDEIFTLEHEYNNGILIPGTTNPQYRIVKFDNFKLTLNKNNSCCKMTCGSIVEIFNLAYCPLLEKHVIIGKKYKCISNFYDNPCPSSLIGIHFVDQLDDNFSYWPLSQVSKKLTRYPHASGFVVIPLLHITT